MLLILTNREDATATYLAKVLERDGIPFLRLDTDDLIAQATLRYTPARPELRIGGRWHAPGSFSHVWYRRPEKLKHPDLDETSEGRYVLSEWTEAFEGFFSHVESRRWMNAPAANAIASHKLNQLSIAAGLGFAVPETLVTQEPEELREFFARHERSGGIIAKPMAVAHIARGPEENDSLIYTNRVNREDLDGLEDLTRCPTLFQRLIPKISDVRITVVDERIHAVSLLATEGGAGGQRCDIRRNNMEDVRYEPATLPPEVDAAVRALMRHYGLRFGAIDMVVTGTGSWYFLEINPNGQWAWLDLCAGQNIAASFVESFSRR